ncbi:plectin-like [Frankliniella occidentalis]|uniref:Plectin-like n=1 Tax=Frankliniella occidentalis TaxID=133901 RepID=A0A6J1SK94_FRAOC|nr:plectin-like [Frankliniella occidentalis]
MRYFRAKTSESASKSAKRRSGQDAAPLAADDQPQCSAAGASGAARWQQEQTKDPYRRQRTPMWKRTTKAQPARPAEPLDAANAPAAGDVEKATKLYKPKSATAKAASETLIGPEEVELVHKEQQTSYTTVQEGGTVLEEYCVEDYFVEEPVEVPSVTRLPVAGPSRPADDEDDDDTDTDDTATDEAVGGVPSTATASTSVPESSTSDRLSAELKALVSLVEMSAGSPIRCTSSSRVSASATPCEETKKAEAADGEGEGIRTWQRNFLGRLTRARQRRDIRLNRKEVLSMQLVLETVLKQHMALSREVEAVKANLQWESLEPVSLSRALSRLQAERNEEAAALDKILACKDKELQAQREQARAAAAASKKQIEVLEQSCREKDADLEKAALALATVHAMHRKAVQDAARQSQEDVAQAQAALDALRASHAAAEAEMAARHKAELSAQLEELRKTMQAEMDEREAALEARLSTLRTNAAAKESRLEMESLRMSRALTQHEAHLGRLMGTVEQLQAQVRDQEAAAKEAREEAAAKGKALVAREAELLAARADQEDVEVLVSKALSARDSDSQHLRDAMEAARKDHERQLQTLRNAAEILRSQKDVEALAYSQAVNEKDLKISAMMIDAEGMRAAIADAENRLAEALDGRGRAEEANAGLLKTVEAMNRQQEDLTLQLRHNFGQLESQAAQLQAQAHEIQHLNELLAQSAHETEELRRVYNDSVTEVERQRRKILEQKDVVAERDRLHKALNDLHANTETEIGNLRKALRDHQHDGDEAARLKKALDKLRQNSAAEAEDLRKAMQELHDSHVVEVKRMQTALQEARSKRKTEAEHFREALHEKDVQIRDLQDEFVKFRLDQEAVQSELRVRNEGLDRDVSVLKNSVSQMKTAHRDRVTALDKKASELAEQARRHKQDAEQARAESRDLQQRAREAERARAQAEQALAKQRQGGQEREGQLNDLVRERDELLADRDGLRMDVDHLAKQRDNCQIVVEEKDREIRALRDKIERLEARADGATADLQQDLRERQEESARLRVELDTALEQREALLAKVSKLFKVVRRSFDRRTSEKAALELELQETRAQLDGAVQSHQAEQDKLMKMMLGKENDMKQLRENLHQYEDHLRSTKEEMDATNSLLKRNIVELEREAHRRDADLRRRDAELARLQGIQADVGKLQLSEQQALERASQLEKSLEDSKRREGELQLELDVGRSVLKKNTEEYRLKMEKLQQNVEHIRAERDSELTVLKDTVARLETELLDRDRQMEILKSENSNQLLELQHALNGRQDETERLTDESERLHRENKALRDKEADLRQAIAYLEDGVAEEVRERDERIAALNEELQRMAEVMKDAVHRDEQEHLQVAEALQEAARAKEAELAALRDAQRRQAADAVEAVRRKDEQIAALEEAVENLRTGLDLELLRLKDQLSQSENERMQLSTHISMLETQLQDQVSLMSKEIADKDAEIRALVEAKTNVQPRIEKENADLSEENAQLLGIMQRMKKEREAEREMREALQAEMHEVIKTTNGALRAKEDRLETLRDDAAEAVSLRQRLEEAEREMGTLRAAAAEAAHLQERLDTLETALSRQHKKDQDFLREQLEKARRDAYEAERKAAEATAWARAQSEAAAGKRNTEILNLPAEAVRQELRSLNQEEGDAGTMERQLRSRQLEVDKLNKMVEALRADLGFQKQLLLTFHEGRAYLGAPSDHDSLTKTAKFIRDPRNTAELTALPQDGDHRQATRSHRRPQYELKRALSEGDNLDLFSTPSDLTLSSITSDLSTTTSKTAVPAYSGDVIV